jgi:hypothetical protein
MNDDHPQQAYVAPDPSADQGGPEPAHSRRRRVSGKAKAVALGALLVGGAGGAAVLGPLAASAASPSASASASPSTGSHTDRPGGPGQGHTEAVSDTSVIAKAIGITEAQLLTELNAGKTPAQVDTAHGVATQEVIDALVQDGLNELAAEVKAGSLTQAQADARKADVTQRATDQVNNGFRAHDGRGGPGQGHTEAVSDTSVIAKAIGITEAQLLTELNAGKTPAQVATAHGVATQEVIDALVQDGLNELAAEVKAGSLTQAQADARKADVTQRATDQVNNGFRGDPH